MTKKKKPKDLKEKARRHLKVNLERIAAHIVDNSSVKDVVNAGLNISLAYAGWKAFKTWQGALFGPVALRLAQSPGGTPPISQIAGVAGLAYLGISLTGGGFADFLADPMGSFEDEAELIKERGGHVYVKPVDGVCPAGSIQMSRAGYQNICVDSNRVRGYKRWGWSVVELQTQQE